MRHVQALLNWILLSTGRTDLKCLVVVVVVVTQAVGLPSGGERMGTKEKENFCEHNQDTQTRGGKCSAGIPKTCE